MPAGYREQARRELLDYQAPDGGWRPTPDFPTDAYATATAVYVLLDTGLAGEDHAVVRGAEWLWRARQPDGSWHVPSRATPVQVFFDNGDPHGADQFISMLATGWATAALSRLQPPARP
jgi:N-acyl-D-amino-acid deacylase